MDSPMIDYLCFFLIVVTALFFEFIYLSICSNFEWLEIIEVRFQRVLL